MIITHAFSFDLLIYHRKAKKYKTKHAWKCNCELFVLLNAKTPSKLNCLLVFHCYVLARFYTLRVKCKQSIIL